jgi:hypothetical protein
MRLHSFSPARPTRFPKKMPAGKFSFQGSSARVTQNSCKSRMMARCGCGKSLKSDGGNPDPQRVETPIFSPQSTLYQLFRKANQHLANHFSTTPRYKIRTPQTNTNTR